MTEAALVTSIMSGINVVLVVIFLALYLSRFEWNYTIAGRAMFAVGLGILLESVGDAVQIFGWTQISALCTILGGVWLAAVLGIGCVMVVRGAPQYRIGSILRPPRLDWRDDLKKDKK